ncbi:DNRLRE domain-containing protein [Alkalihalophilus pseudofirmus]|uniref:DNRLRE domain-containing protein n=1 Tax=Alkalihalophilus pseudofirmus TaxID=79885 RepID=UPI00259B8787|nr:DNRLRE domain-containing protein [Alkalihalophilus pseudofirmus]WEG18468.1 DNRLRE domain-containing protein [Alkalihalophilus pseudofirmus]
MGWHQNEDGELYFHPENKMYGRVRIDSVEELDSGFVITKPKDLDSQFIVNKHTRMQGRIDIVENIIEQDAITPIKDAFIRSSLPFFNYGKAQDLLIGKQPLSNDTYRTFIEFNNDDLVPDIEITKAILKLHTSDLAEFIPNIKLYAAKSHWSEQGVTWANQPEQGELIAEISDSVRSKRILEFDITHIANQWKNEEGYSYGFILVSDDESITQTKRFFSRESIYSPIIDYEYFVLSPPSYGGIEVNAGVRVTHPDSSDMQSSLDVFRYEGDVDLESSTHVRIRGEMSAGFDVNKQNLDCSVFVGAETELAATFSTLINQANDFPNTFNISKHYMDAGLVVHRESEQDVTSSFYISRNDNVDLENSFYVLQPYFDSKIEVTNYKELESELIVNKDSEVDLVGTIAINKDTLEVEIEILHAYDIESNVNVRLNDVEDLSGELIVKREQDIDLRTAIDVTWYDDLTLKINVYESDNADLDTNISIQKHDEESFVSTIDVTEWKELEGTVFVLQNDFDSSVTIERRNYEELETQLHISPNHEIESSVEVTQYSDLDSSFSATIPFYNDLNTNLEVIEQGGVESSVAVNRDNLSANIEVSPTSELISNVDIHHYNDLNSNLEVLIPHAEDINTQLEVMEQGALDTEIHVTRESLDSTITVSKTELDSSLIIQRDLEITFSVLNDWLDSSVTVANETLDTRLAVIKTNLDATIDVIGIGSEDIHSSFYSHYPYDAGATVSVPYNNSMHGKVRFEQFDELDAAFTVVKDIDKELNAELGIFPHNRMQGKTEIIHPEPIQKSITPIRDAFVRSGNPYMNYGDTMDMLSGVNFSGEIFRSFIQFDISKLPTNIQFDEAKLVLTLPNALPINYTIGLYGVSAGWNEYGITYINQPNATELIKTFSGVPLANNRIEFDLMEIIEDWYKNETYRNGFVIKLIDESNTQNTRFFTRESHYSPFISLSYYDLTTKNHLVGDVDSGFTVINHQEEELNAELHVETYQRDHDFYSEINVQNGSYLDSEIVVERQNLNAAIYIPNQDDAELHTTFSIIDRRIDEIESMQTVSKPFFDTSLIVHRNADSDLDGRIQTLLPADSDFDVSFIISTQDEYDILSGLSINRAAFDTEITVSPTEDLGTTIDVLNKSEDDIHTTFESVYIDDLDSIFEVVNNGVIDSSVTVLQEDDDELEVVITVSPASDIQSSLFVSPESNLNAEFRVSREDDTEIESEIEVTQVFSLGAELIVNDEAENDFNSIIEVIEPSIRDLDSEIDVGSYQTLNSQLYVPHSDLESTTTINLISKEDLPSSVLVRLPEVESELAASIGVVLDDEDSINTSITVLSRGIQEIESSIIISTEDDLHLTFEVRQAIGYAFIF